MDQNVGYHLLMDGPDPWDPGLANKERGNEPIAVSFDNPQWRRNFLRVFPAP